MTDVSRQPVQSIVDWAYSVARLAAPHDVSVPTAVDRAIDQLRQNRIKLTVIGKTNSGKSTLINALLGRPDDQVAPIDRLPASSSVSKFFRDERESATVVFRDGRREAIQFHEIRRYVTEDENPGNYREVAAVEISGPFANLPADLELVDTPGAGSMHEYHDELLLDFLPSSDAVIFLISARMPLDREELALLERVQKTEIEKVFFAVNRVDEVTPPELDEALQHNRRLLASVGAHPSEVYLLSAKRAYQGDREGGGLNRLTAAIGQFLTQGRSEILQRQFSIRVAQLIVPTLSALEVKLSTWSQSEQQLEDSRRQLQQSEAAMVQGQRVVEREFQLAWERAVDAYEDGLRRARSQMLAALEDTISAAALSDVSALARRLPRELGSAQERMLREPAAAFEQAVHAACASLQVESPRLPGESDDPMQRLPESNEVAIGLAGGASLAAAGAGLAAAGGAAATTIAAANTAALTATTTVSAPSFIASLLTFAGLPELATLATGTATVAAPTALTVTPLWVALSGPVGWTLAGIGAFAVPFSWRLSKIRKREQLAEAARQQINSTFEQLIEQRLAALRRMGVQIAAEANLRFERRLLEAKQALIAAPAACGDRSQIADLKRTVGALRSLLIQSPSDSANTQRSSNDA